jgi:replicative DNA helicase
MRRLIEAGRAADPTMLKAVFDQDPALQAHGGAAYLGQLVKAGMYRRARVEVEQLARLVHDCWLRRELILLATEAIEAAYRVDIDNPPMAQVEGLEAGLRRLAEGGQAGPRARSLSAMMAQTLANADAAYKRGDQITGVLTGFADLDKVLGGLHPSDLVVLAARPSMGKSALAENIARNAAKAGGGVCFYSLEMSAEQLTARTLAGEGQVPADWIRRPAEFNRYSDHLVIAQRRLEPVVFYTDDEAGLSVATMHSRARRLKRQHGLDLIVTDYLQLATAPRTGRREQNRVQEVGEITNALKRMAKDLNVPVLALSQLSRQVEVRTGKRPLLSDLRESGAIEQDADVVMFIYRQEYYEPDNEDVRNLAEVIVAKNRHGPTATVQLFFDNNTTQFSNLARDR